MQVACAAAGKPIWEERSIPLTHALIRARPQCECTRWEVYCGIANRANQGVATRANTYLNLADIKLAI